MITCDSQKVMLQIGWCVIILISGINAGSKSTPTCPKPFVHFEKIIGVRPPNINQQLLLYKSQNRPITTECVAKCLSNEQCKSFVVFYTKFECYWFKQDYNEEEDDDNVFDNDVAWFVKACLKVGKKCNKLWLFERVVGATLIGNDTKTLPQPLSRRDCQQYCLNETRFSCRSVKYTVSYGNSALERDIDTKGICVLSNSDRHFMPNSYRASAFDDEYFENQCADDGNIKNKDDLKKDYCAYEEYSNVSLAHSDVQFDKKTREECQNLCETSETFNCRGFSIVNGNINSCFLHSEDSKIHGPKLLQPDELATYYEKARCLTINVSCSETYMTIKYLPEVDFHGKIYMQGYSENPACYATGQGRYSLITLKLPILTSQCGIYKADGQYNRTLLSSTMIVQYNPFIQTQGDRLIRVGCIFGNETRILIGTGVKITSSLPNKGSPLLNTSSNETTGPMVEMRVLDLNTQQEISDTQIGQELQLVIEITDKNSSYDIWASHLIAMTEKSDESIFLVDDRGCPTNLNIFPPLEKVVNQHSRRLVGNFQAFKFASSPVVRFSVIVQFCPKECPPIQCDNKIQSNGARKREISTHTIQTIDGTHVLNVNRSEFDRKSGMVNEMPLEYIMVVRDPKSRSDRLVLGESGRILVAGYDYTTNEVCMDYSLVVGLIVTWILVQAIFVICCVVLVRRYKRYYQHECTQQSLEELHKNFGIGFSNLDNRRVHWADNENMMSN